ncbi:hypothetical protein CARUB_v10023786mg [Capsella rubella]|uniref:Uncharacterized protein n=1 Tax=Capsella rubella TaxID=81985 RepID=R0HU78_9BRAS|nr:hypothetical protein CARUB_v10023786mg [Capsella rubella]
MDRFNKAPKVNQLLPYRVRLVAENMSWSLCSTHGVSSMALTYGLRHSRRSTFRICATSDGVEPKEEPKPPESPLSSSSSSSSSPSALGTDLKKVVNKTAATFAPRASTASKNPAVPGSTLYKVFEVQGYASMFVGGVLSFNLLFPSNEPDLWRLMGMWSIWMFSKSPSLLSTFIPSCILPTLFLICSWQLFLLFELETVQVKRKRLLITSFLSSRCSMLLYPSFTNPLLLSGLLIQLPSLQCMPGRYCSFRVGMIFIGLLLVVPHISFFFNFCLLLQLGWLQKTE